MMERYKALSGDAGVHAFRIVHEGIIVEFQDGRRYLYNAKRPGGKHVTEMIKLAHKGEGLTTYINQHVRENYAAQL